MVKLTREEYSRIADEATRVNLASGRYLVVDVDNVYRDNSCEEGFRLQRITGQAKVRKILRALDSAVQDAVCGDPIVCRHQRIRPKL